MTFKIVTLIAVLMASTSWAGSSCKNASAKGLLAKSAALTKQVKPTTSKTGQD